ncbi:MAG: FAD-dependent oxidoreductase [Pseudomonadota bacterium]
MKQCDVVVIGAGIAGASMASALAVDHSVVLLEREDTPGYHTTGRSAALFTPTYGPPQIRALTRASQAFFDAPSPDFTSVPLVRQRDVLLLARTDQRASLEAAADPLSNETSIEWVEGDRLQALHPLLRPGYADCGVLNRDSADIDVDAVLAAWLRRFRARGGELQVHAEVTGLRRVGERWQLRTPNGTLSATWVVNAAGAWADAVARLAGAEGVGVVPKRRTVAVIASPLELGDARALPVAIDVDEQFFLKPEAGRLLVSPADATPSSPTDARPEEWDIAVGIERVQRAFALDVTRVESAWAGLRCFVPDGLPVVGPDPTVPGFFWLCGQGGYGIQTALAMAALGAALLRRDPLPEHLVAEGVDAAALRPGR